MKKNKCPICGGNFEPGFTTISKDNDNNLIVFRKVPALICSNCGEEYIEDSVLQQIEKKLAKPIDKYNQVEILAYS
jgi:YgiT-type zinc finger domain-containing protein